MKIDAEAYQKLPEHLKALFQQTPNHSRDEVVGLFPESKGQQGAVTGSEASSKTANAYGDFSARNPSKPRADKGSAARFFYCAKASPKDRHHGVLKDSEAKGNTHPTVKPTELMRYLVRLVTPKGGTTLDMFCGSGSTGRGAVLEGINFIGFDQDAGSVDIANQRVAAVLPEEGSAQVSRQA